jgi:hypothetical protein
MNIFLFCALRAGPDIMLWKNFPVVPLCYKFRFSELLCKSTFYNCGLTDQNPFYMEFYMQSELIANFSSSSIIIIIIIISLKFALFLILKLHS